MTDNIPNFPSYFISKEGELFSLRQNKKWKAVKPFVKKGGYLQVCLNKNNVRKYFLIHQIVAMVYLGPRPHGYHVCHYDGNPQNNNLSNLRYDTAKNNIKDKERHGTKLIGETTNNAILTESQVLEILNLRASGVSATKIAEMFHVHKSNILQIQKRSTWSHVKISDELSNKLKETISLVERGEVRVFSEPEIKALFELKATGVSNEFLAEKYKTNSIRIKSILERKIYSNIEIDPNVLASALSVKRVGNLKILSNDDLKKLMKMKSNGDSYSVIAKEFGLTVIQVKNAYFKYRKVI